MDPDRIDKRVLLRAPQERVWQAVSDAERFGQWFGVAFDGPFVVGGKLTGRIAPTTVDPEVAKLQEPHAGMRFAFIVERIEPTRLIAFRWHPYAVDPSVDYSREPTTLIEFVLEPTTDGTLLSITESGFDRIPLERRAKAFAANDGGWEMQTKLIEKYLTMRHVD
ncbi:MAG TPA: SRPBCC family protein [Acetobacteraceae bacterium]|nr:SRPBCC family protein [Acetobacteraceae bacterium]